MPSRKNITLLKKKTNEYYKALEKESVVSYNTRALQDKEATRMDSIEIRDSEVMYRASSITRKLQDHVTHQGLSLMETAHFNDAITNMNNYVKMIVNNKFSSGR